MTTTRPPAEVWLQWHGNGDPTDGDPEPGTVTWHPEPVYDSDVGPYVLDSAGLRARAEKAEAERDEERRQRIHEAELAREAIAHLRALIDAIEDEGHEKAHAAACAFLDGVRV